MPKYIAKIKPLYNLLILGLSLTLTPLSFAQTDLRQTPVVKAVRKIGPSVVNISSEQTRRNQPSPFSNFGFHPFFDSFFKDFMAPEYERRAPRSSLGSGIIIDGQKGFILTNAHVIENTAQIMVTLQDKQTFPAKVIGVDAEADLAVLQIEPKGELPDTPLSSSDDLLIGETVIAIGNPFGFSHTVTTGVISALDRTIRTDDRIYRNFIQTDASINPGNSGGPLLNINGDLIGINTAVYAKAQGIGFAIPVARAHKIVTDLIEYGEVIPAWLGLILQPIDQAMAGYLNLDEELQRRYGGLLIKKVTPEGPGHKAGLKSGQLLLAVNQRPIASIGTYRATMKEVGVDQTVELLTWQNGALKKVRVRSASFPEKLADQLPETLLGITAADITRKLASRFNLRSDQGVLVLDIHKDVGLGRIGARAGDVLHQINTVKLRTLTDLKKALVQYRHQNSVVILLERERQIYHVTVEF